MTSYLRTPSVERLPVLLEELYNGALRIPPFQRDFEWKGEQRLALFDSIWKGLPTGALMVWRTALKLPSEDPIGPYALLPTENSPSPQYLLDGRQRMTTLYAALAGGLFTRDERKPARASDSAPDGTPWDIGFDLEEQIFECANPWYLRIQGRGPFLPLAVVLDDLAYDEWRVGQVLSREHTNRARALRVAFNDYLIPVLPLATDDVGVVTLTFKRVNSGGTQMGDAAMARALAWTHTFDLRSEMDQVRERLNPHGWGELDDDTLLKVVASVLKLDPTEPQLETLADSLKKDVSSVDHAGNCVLLAARLLGRIGIVGPGSLPYAQILVFLARAIVTAQLSEEQDRQAIAWTVEACLDERFGGAPPHMVRVYWRDFARRLGLVEGESAEKHPRKVRECRRFSMAWARSRATAVVLADNRPTVGDGSPLPDPFALVARGTECVGMLIAPGAEGLPPAIRRNRNLKAMGSALRSPANRIVCPPSELIELRAWLFDDLCASNILASHLISASAHEALVDGDLETFFERRRQSIMQAEREWAAKHGAQIDLVPDPTSYDDL
ncbi:MAG: DUF262 domain-containing protein [Polyangiaceae bacterium]